jgi:hypothetical protein
MLTRKLDAEARKSVCGLETGNDSHRNFPEAPQRAKKPRFIWLTVRTRLNRSSPSVKSAFARQSGLFPAASDEFDLGRTIFGSRQYESARRQRLHLRRAHRLRFRRGAGPFSASADVQTAVTKESVQEFLKESTAFAARFRSRSRNSNTTNKA